MELGNLYNHVRTQYPGLNVMVYNNKMRIEVGGDIGYVYIEELDVNVPYRYHIRSGEKKISLMLSNAEFILATTDRHFKMWNHDMTADEFFGTLRQRLATMGKFAN